MQTILHQRIKSQFLIRNHLRDLNEIYVGYPLIYEKLIVIASQITVAHRGEINGNIMSPP